MHSLEDLDTILKKVKLTPHDVLVDVFETLVTATWPYIQRQNGPDSIWLALSSLGLPLKASGKPKAPGARLKKKPPPQKKALQPQVTALSQRFPLFWSPVTGGLPVPEEDNDNFLGPMCSLFDVDIPSVKGTLGKIRDDLFRFDSTIEECLVDDAVSKLNQWFEREKRAVKYKVSVLRISASRQSALSSNLSQRLSIMLHSLKRAISPGALLNDVKLALLGCSMKKESLVLLTEVVPNEDDPAGMRKSDEWRTGAASVLRLIKDQPQLVLTEDEEFMVFVSAFPSFYKRLQIMYIITAFLDIQADLVDRLNTASRAIRIILGHGAIKYVWKLILAVGNRLNEGTNRGEQTWFRLSALRRVLEVRGNQSMTLPEYLSGYTGMMFDANEWRLLQKAKDISCPQVYGSAKDVLETYAMMLQPPSEKNKLPPLMTDSIALGDLEDKFYSRISEFTQQNLQAARELLHAVVEFRHWYHVAAYYFGEPNGLLPLESAVEGDVDSEDSPARDFFMRIWYFMSTVRARVPMTRMVIDNAEYTGYINNTLLKKFTELPGNVLRKETSMVKPPGSETQKYFEVPSSYNDGRSSQTVTPRLAVDTIDFVSQPVDSNHSSPKSVIIEDNPAMSSRPPLPAGSRRTRRFGGFRGGSRLLNDEASMQRLREKLMMDQTAIAAPIARGEDVIGILAPRGPPRKRRPRSSIDATFNLAMHVGK